MNKLFKLIFQSVLIISLSSCAATLNFNEEELGSIYSFFTGEQTSGYDLDNGLDLPYTAFDYLTNEEDIEAASILIELVKDNKDDISACTLSHFRQEGFPLLLEEGENKSTFFIFSAKEASTIDTKKSKSASVIVTEEKEKAVQKVVSTPKTTKTIAFAGTDYILTLLCQMDVFEEPVGNDKSLATFSDDDINNELGDREPYLERKEKGVTRFKVDILGEKRFYYEKREGDSYNYRPDKVTISIRNGLTGCDKMKFTDTNRIEVIGYKNGSATIYISNAGRANTITIVCKEDLDPFTKGTTFSLGKDYEVTGISSDLITIEETSEVSDVFVIDSVKTPEDYIDYFTEFEATGTQVVNFKSYSTDNIPTIAQGIYDLNESDSCTNLVFTDIVPVAVDLHLGVTFFRANFPYDTFLCYEISPRYLQGTRATYSQNMADDILTVTITEGVKR